MSKNDDHTENVIPFPICAEPGTGKLPAETLLGEALLNEILKPIRETDARRSLQARLGVTEEQIEKTLREPELRSRTAASMESYLAECLPKALQVFVDALADRQSWAFKVLFDAIGFPKLAANLLNTSEPEPEVVISHAFERDIVQKMLSLLRGQAVGPSAFDKSTENQP